MKPETKINIASAIFYIPFTILIVMGFIICYHGIEINNINNPFTWLGLFIIIFCVLMILSVNILLKNVKIKPAIQFGVCYKLVGFLREKNSRYYSFVYLGDNGYLKMDTFINIQFVLNHPPDETDIGKTFISYTMNGKLVLEEDLKDLKQ